MEKRWKLRKVIRIKIDLVLAAASVKVFLSFFAQSEKFFGKKSFFIFPGGFFSLTSCRNLLKDLKKRWKWDWQRRSGSLICHQWKAKLHLDLCKLAGYVRCSTWSCLEVSHLSAFWKWRKSGWSESVVLLHHSKVATKCCCAWKFRQGSKRHRCSVSRSSLKGMAKCFVHFAPQPSRQTFFQS